MRVVTFGYITWGRRTIEAVREAGHEVPLIVTHPDSDDAYEKIFNESVAEFAAHRGIPLLVRNRANDVEVRGAITATEADVMVVSSNAPEFSTSIHRLAKASVSGHTRFR